MSTTKHGVTFEDAYNEAAAIAYTGRAILDCFSLAHPALPEVLYFVNNYESFTATVPDISSPVEFLAVAVRIGKPEESDKASSPEITLEVDNVSGAPSDALKLVRGSLEPFVLTNYLYASDDTTQPVVWPPTVMHVTKANYDEVTSRLTGTFGDAGNFAIPALTFKRAAYPSLSRAS